MNNEIARYSEETFESIKHVNEYGNEFWYARELQRVLEYTQWRRFADAIERAKLACSNSGYSASEHFADAGKSSPMPHGGVRILEDYRLSRYACYLIVMNGDPRKEVIAVGQTYFAVKTRQQELIDHYDELSEDQKLTVNRARKVQKFLGQPFHVAKQFTGIDVKYVKVEDTVRSFKMIIDGEMDDVPEQAFRNKGDIEEVLEAAKELV